MAGGGAFCQIIRLKVSLDATPGKSRWELSDAGRYVSRQFPEEVKLRHSTEMPGGAQASAEELKVDRLVRSKPACLLLKRVWCSLPVCPWASEQVSAMFWNKLASSWPPNGLVRGGGGTQWVEMN